MKEEESVLDGILPKDFGKPDVGGMLANLLDKKPETPQRQMVNGVGGGPQKVVVNHAIVNGGLKRPASAESNGEGNGIPPNKRPMLDCNGTVVTNGPAMNDGDVIKSDVNLGQAAFQNNNTTLTQQPSGLVIQPQSQMVTPGGQKIITGTDGKQYIVKTGPGCGNGTVIGTVTAAPVTSQAMVSQQQMQQPQQQQINGGGQVLYTQNTPGGGKTIIILQPQAKVLTSSTGQQVVVQNTQPQTVMVQNAAGQPQTLVVQNPSGVQQQVVVQNAAGLQQQLVVQNAAGVQQQVLVQNPVSVASPMTPQTIMRAVTTQPTTMTFSPRPQFVGANVAPRPIATPTPPPSTSTQVPIQGIVRVSTPPVAQSPVQVPTPPPPLSSSPSPIPQTLVVPVSAPATPSIPIPKPDPAAPFLCEWHGCMKAFKAPKEVERHAISTHCPPGSDDIPCLWLRCDGMKRKRFSLMTHLQDRHCHPQVEKNLQDETSILNLEFYSGLAY